MRGLGVERVAVIAGAVVAGVLVSALSCLPDLETAAPTPPVPAFCGDGVVDLVDAGERCDPGEAGAKGCTRRCLIDCPGGFVDDGGTNHCYFSAGAAASEKAANDLCAARGAHVVTFASEEERAKVQAALAPSGVYWVGLGYDPTAAAYAAMAPTEPGWKDGCTGCFAHVADGGALPRFRPDAASGQCVGDAVDASSWFQLACFNPGAGTVMAICEREPPGAADVPCDGGVCLVLPETVASKRYLLGLETVTAAGATTACAGGRLVVLQSREEREALMRSVAHALGSPPVDTAVWVGLARVDGGAWTWEDGQPLDASYPSPWGDKQPRATVATARAYASLAGDFDIELARADDKSQTTRHPYLCEYAVTP